MAVTRAKEEHVNSRLAVIAQADTKKWYNKPNLRYLYLIFVPCALGVECTSGFYSSMMNSLQAVAPWVECVFPSLLIPFMPTVPQYLGHRWTIMSASVLMCLGAGSRSVDMFLASRWVLGFGIPFAIVNALSLIGELSYEKERRIMIFEGKEIQEKVQNDINKQLTFESSSAGAIQITSAIPSKV
ncbi:hypothetical protein F4809DRAFT_601725 [Biscogniauxia mediterranea]|nr:hypothetical protein F4809DRAFT_601725 [Biscogniauxia mediterranea]